MSQQQAPADFGRVDPDGTVYVRVGDTERSVGQIPDSTPEEALAFYTRRYENLAAEVTLLVSRVETQTMSPEEARKAIERLVDLMNRAVRESKRTYHEMLGQRRRYKKKEAPIDGSVDDASGGVS